MSDMASQRYEEFQKFVDNLAFKAWSKCGGDLEEMKSIAYYAYVHACNSFKAEKGTLDNWIRVTVRGHLHSYIQNRLMWKEIRVEFYEESVEQVDQFNLPRFLADLPTDARNVAKLAVETLPDDGKVKRINRRTMQRKIRRLLLQKGWSKDRIVEAFEAIGEALS